MNFEFVCGNCDADNVVWGEPVASWWTQKYRVPDEWDCWCCGATNTTPDPPWTPAD